MERLKKKPIGILFESREWSIFALGDHIAAMGVPVKLFDLQDELDAEGIRSCGLIVNRVFASAVFRGHQKAHEQMPAVIELLRKYGIRMINPAETHYYEISKTRIKEKLLRQGFLVPRLYDTFSPATNTEYAGTLFPCIVKPDCGGRTTNTFIAYSREELLENLKNMPDILFISEEYIRPEKGYITRIEVIDRACRLAVKRSVTENGLSAYHLGSAYEIYDDLPDAVRDAAIKAMDCLKIEVGSLDIIENTKGAFIIDVNPASNVSEDNTEMFNFDLMKETAAYAVKIYDNLSKEKRTNA